MFKWLKRNRHDDATAEPSASHAEAEQALQAANAQRDAIRRLREAHQADIDKLRQMNEANNFASWAFYVLAPHGGTNDAQ